MNRFREQFAALSFPRAGQSVNVTASFGVTGFQGKELQEFAALVRKADQMLYEAKRGAQLGAAGASLRIFRPYPSTLPIN